LGNFTAVKISASSNLWWWIQFVWWNAYRRFRKVAKSDC